MAKLKKLIIGMGNTYNLCLGMKERRIPFLTLRFAPVQKTGRDDWITKYAENLATQVDGIISDNVGEKAYVFVQGIKTEEELNFFLSKLPNKKGYEIVVTKDVVDEDAATFFEEFLHVSGDLYDISMTGITHYPIQKDLVVIE